MGKKHRVVWLGGGAAAGKTTVCKALSERFGYTPYYCDSKVNERLANAEPGSAAHVIRQVVESDKARREFFDQDVDDIVAVYVAWAREEFDTTYREVEQMSNDYPVIIEGAFHISPNFLRGKVDPANCVFLFSTSRFQQQTWNARTWYLTYTDKASDPETAAKDFIAASMQMSEMLRAECEVAGFRSIITGGKIGIEAATKKVEEYLRLGV